MIRNRIKVAPAALCYDPEQEKLQRLSQEAFDIGDVGVSDLLRKMAESLSDD